MYDYTDQELTFDLCRAAKRLGALWENAEIAGDTARIEQIKAAIHCLATDCPYVNFSHTVGTFVNYGREIVRYSVARKTRPVQLFLL